MSQTAKSKNSAKNGAVAASHNSEAIKYERSRVGGVLKDTKETVKSMALTFKASPYSDNEHSKILFAEVDWLIKSCFVEGTHFSDRRVRDANNTRPSATQLASLPTISSHRGDVTWRDWLLTKCRERMHNKKVRPGAKLLYACLVSRLTTPETGSTPGCGITYLDAFDCGVQDYKLCCRFSDGTIQAILPCGACIVQPSSGKTYIFGGSVKSENLDADRAICHFRNHVLPVFSNVQQPPRSPLRAVATNRDAAGPTPGSLRKRPRLASPDEQTFLVGDDKENPSPSAAEIADLTQMLSLLSPTASTATASPAMVDSASAGQSGGNTRPRRAAPPALKLENMQNSIPRFTVSPHLSMFSPRFLAPVLSDAYSPAFVNSVFTSTPVGNPFPTAPARHTS